MTSHQHIETSIAPGAPHFRQLNIDTTVLSDRGPMSAVLVLTGRLDAVETPEVRAELNRVLAAGTRALIIDLVAVSFIDSAGLAALVRIRRDIQTAGGDVVLISPEDPGALRVFRLTQFDQVFRLVDSRAKHDR